MPREVKWFISFLVGAVFLFIGWKFYPFLIALHVLVCMVLIIVILLQSGEAADLAGAFGGSGSQTAFGPRGAATLLSRATTWCAIMFMFTSMALAVRVSSGTPAGNSILEQFSNSAPAPATTPSAPAAPSSQPVAPSQPANPAAPTPTPAAPAK
jgi:preprotein translocase subunit SecG